MRRTKAGSICNLTIERVLDSMGLIRETKNRMNGGRPDFQEIKRGLYIQEIWFLFYGKGKAGKPALFSVEMPFRQSESRRRKKNEDL